MEILVRDHRFDVLVVGVGRRVRPRQQPPAVENVEPLILHGAHVEVIGTEDHEVV